MSWKTWTLQQWIERMTEWSAYVLAVPRVAVLLVAGCVTWAVALAAVGLYYGAVYALWPLVVGIPLARQALPYLLFTPWGVGAAAVLGVWRAVRFCLRFLDPAYRAERREAAAFARWVEMSPAAREAVADHLRAVRRTGVTLSDQGVRLVREEKWARDGRVQAELAALCRCHPRIEEVAARVLKEAERLTLRPDTVEAMHDLWRAAWRYREAEQAAELAELRLAEREKLSPAERFERWRKVGLFGGVAAFACGFLYAYPLQTLALGGIGLTLAVIVLAAKAADALKTAQSTSNKENENVERRVLPLLPDQRRPVRGL